MRRQPIPILTYHQVDEAPPRGTPYRSLTVAPAAFDRQMRLLSLMGYRGLSLSHLEPYLNGEREGKVVGITFDDGYVNNLTHALPALQRHGHTATCFVVSGELGGANRWDEAKGIPRQPLMTLAQLRQWVAGGQEVGAHTRHHADLPSLDEAAARVEVEECKQELEAALGQPVRHFCYPYGRYGPAHVAMVRNAGYATAATTQRGRVQPQDNLLELPRVPVLLSTSLPLLALKLMSAYEDRRRS